MSSEGVVFTHGHNYQDHLLGCATALKVQQIIQRDYLLANVRSQEAYLAEVLKRELGSQSHVGNIRGQGLLWGIKFVEDKANKEPSDPRLQIAQQVHSTALAEPYNIIIYYGQGCAGDRRDDYVMIMPAYNTASETINLIFDTLASGRKGFCRHQPVAKSIKKGEGCIKDIGM